nr:conjugal transfer protein TraN [Providencia alcalifaciens]
MREQAVFSCQKELSGTGKMCGVELVCASGECDQIKNDKANSFQKAVSALAAVAAAGEDVAELNDVNVRAFTGKRTTCRKAAAGFNNCCKSGGWGSDVGLAHCDSEEKALGKAKQRKLTVYVGSYWSNNVLGVCLQKKEAYCLFDSKLAKIVQEQGRGSYALVLAVPKTATVGALPSMSCKRLILTVSTSLIFMRTWNPAQPFLPTKNWLTVWKTR